MDSWGAGHRWVVLTTGACTLPNPPIGFADRTLTDGTANGPPTSFKLAAFYLPSGRTLYSIASVGGPTLASLEDQAFAFSVLDYLQPSIAITSPASGAMVAAGASVTVLLNNDTGHPNPADDNLWVLCASSGNSAIASTSTCTIGGAVSSTGGAMANLPTQSVEGAAVGSGYRGYLHAVLTDHIGAPVALSQESVISFSVP